MRLPPGWTSCDLAEVASFINGDRGKNYPAKTARVSHGVPFINAGHLASGRVDMREMDYIPRERFDLLGSGKVQAGDLLFCLRGSLGKAALVTADEGAIASSLVILRPTGAATSEYLLAYLQSPFAASMIARYDNGTAQPNLSSRNVERFLLPLAPSREQRSIVEALDSYLTRLDAAVASLERAQRKLKAYRASVLKAAVEGRLVPTEAELARKEGRSYEPASALLERILNERRRRWEDAELVRMRAAGKSPRDDRWKANYLEPEEPDTNCLTELPEGWCWATVDQVAEDTLIGLVRNREEQRADPPGHPYLKMDGIGLDGTISLANLVYVDADAREVDRYALREGDILFNTRNSVELVGKTAVVPSCGLLLFNNNIMRIRASASLSASFIGLQMSSPSFRAALERVKRATTSVAAIYGKDLYPLPIALPPAEEQERIVNAVARLVSVQEAAVRDVKRQLARCSRLRQSVLKWAFEGRLVDQDPADEPADALLARIHAEREAGAFANPEAKRSRKLKAS